MYRLLIADDERIECMVLEHIFQHEMREQIEVLDSVQDGIAFLAAVEEKQPDIAIVDINMPCLGGLDAIELLQSKRIKLKLIIHTAYSEFSYAQRAIQLGAADYLVKPNLKDEMIAAVKKVCQMLDQEAEHEKARISKASARQEIQDLALSKWMMSLLLEQPDPDSFQVVCEYFPDALSGGIITLWKADAKTEGEIATSYTIPDNKKRSILEQGKKKLSSLCNHASVCYENDLYCVLFPGERIKAGDWREWLSQLIFCVVQENIKKTAPADEFRVGVSRWKEAKDFLSGLHEARASLWHRSQSGIFFYQEDVTSVRKPSEKINGQLIAKTAKTLADSVIKQEENKGLEELLEQIDRLIIPHYFSAKEKLTVKKMGGAAFLLSMEEELERLSANQTRTGIFWKDFFQIQSLEALSLWCKKKLEESCVHFHSPKETENPYITHTCALIAENYAQDLWLEGMAETIGITPFYLSRLLKQEKNATFVEIVTDIRIRKAFLLLLQSHKSIREIAALTGYPNQSYFYRVFKKTTGIAVGDIRKYLW